MTNTMFLIDPDLGELELGSDPFVLATYSIGSPAVRENTRTRALADGGHDDTEFSGARAVTLTLRLNESNGCPSGYTMQDLYDMILPYTRPRRRPVLRWTLPRSTGQREMTVRGVSAPVEIAGPKHPVLVVSFVSIDGTITTAGDESYLRLTPSDSVEAGRSYDLTFPRTYPFSLPRGDRILVQSGNERAHWRGRISGAADIPQFSINDVSVIFDQNGTLDLAAGQWLDIDTKARTMLLNGVVTDSRYDRSNFTEWTWDDLMLKPGNNLVNFTADTLGPAGAMEMWWKATWA